MPICPSSAYKKLPRDRGSLGMFLGDLLPHISHKAHSKTSAQKAGHHHAHHHIHCRRLLECVMHTVVLYIRKPYILSIARQHSRGHLLFIEKQLGTPRGARRWFATAMKDNMVSLRTGYIAAWAVCRSIHPLSSMRTASLRPLA